MRNGLEHGLGPIANLDRELETRRRLGADRRLERNRATSINGRRPPSHERFDRQRREPRVRRRPAARRRGCRPAAGNQVASPSSRRHRRVGATGRPGRRRSAASAATSCMAPPRPDQRPGRPRPPTPESWCPRRRGSWSRKTRRLEPTGPGAGGDVGREQLFGHRRAERRIGVAKMAAEQVVESASWSDEWSSPYHQNQSLPSAISSSSSARSRAAGDTAPRASSNARARVRQLSPGAMVVAMADPDVEVAVDPGAGEDRRQRRGRARGRLGHGDGLDVGGRSSAPIERAQERPAAAGVVLPRVLAVEDHRHGRDFPAGRLPRTGGPPRARARRNRRPRRAASHDW